MRSSAVSGSPVTGHFEFESTYFSTNLLSKMWPDLAEITGSSGVVPETRQQLKIKPDVFRECTHLHKAWLRDADGGASNHCEVWTVACVPRAGASRPQKETSDALENVQELARRMGSLKGKTERRTGARRKRTGRACRTGRWSSQRGVEPVKTVVTCEDLR